MRGVPKWRGASHQCILDARIIRRSQMAKKAKKKAKKKTARKAKKQ
jgi:hypothetical protein